VSRHKFEFDSSILIGRIQQNQIQIWVSTRIHQTLSRILGGKEAKTAYGSYENRDQHKKLHYTASKHQHAIKARPPFNWLMPDGAGIW